MAEYVERHGVWATQDCHDAALWLQVLPAMLGIGPALLWTGRLMIVNRVVGVLETADG